MSRVGGISEQDQLVMMPAFANDPPEFQPDGRPGQVCGVAEQRLSIEISGEDLLALRDSFGLVQAVEAKLCPGGFRTFDDERRTVVGEAIGVGPDPAGVGLLERKGEGVEGLGRAEPDEAVGSFLDVDPEMLGMGLAKAAVDAVGRDDQIPIGPTLKARIALGLVMDLDPKFEGTIGQDLKQPLAADADEAMPGRADARAMDMNVDIVPMGEFVGDDAA